MLATRFGSDIGARGPNGTAPCLDGPFSVQRCNGASQISFTPVQPIVFDPRTQSYVVFSPIERLVIKPAAGVPTVADPRTGELLLFDTPHQRIIRVNLIEQRVIAIDQITGVATPLPLEALLQHRLIEIQVIDAPAIAPLSLATLGVPRVLPDRLALLAAFVGGAGLLGLARRSAPYQMPASGGAAANVPPWLAALGQVFLGLLIGVGALLALAALIYAGAALLAAVGIGAALSFAAALAVAAVILAVGFVALEFSERMQAFRARRGEPGVGDLCPARCAGPSGAQRYCTLRGSLRWRRVRPLVSSGRIVDSIQTGINTTRRSDRQSWRPWRCAARTPACAKGGCAMTAISARTLFCLYRDTVARATSAILSKSDDEIAYDLFEEFDVGTHSFLHDESLARLHRAGLLSADGVSLSRQLRARWLALQEDHDWSIAEIRTHPAWQDLFAPGDAIMQRLGAA
jgi:hypothetical protein